MEEREKLLDEIDAFLEEIGGYTDYNGRVDAVAEKFGMSRDEAENYVWMWASEVPGNVRYKEIESKSVMDSDGFYTDYTWYKDIVGHRHVFVFGDRDLYRPEDEDYDWEVEGDDEQAQAEAEEWFDSYNGFDEGEDDYNEDDMMDESLRSTMTWCNISHPLKEAADREIDRKGFKSLIKYGVRDGGGNYAVLNDGHLVRKFWADNDDEAKEIFRRGPSHMPSLTQDPMAAGQWYESLDEAKEEDPKTQAFKKATAAVEKKKEEDKKQNTAQRKKDLMKLEKELEKEKDPKRQAFLQATINRYKKEIKESLKEEVDDDWYSQVHAPKSEVIAWLQDHEQAWEDITNYFKVKSLDYIGLDQIEEWISEHDELAQDFENYFGEKSK